MTTLLLILGLSFGLCLILTPLAGTLAKRYGLIDRPDGRRKIHASATPLGGGLAILLSGCGALAAVLVALQSMGYGIEGQGFGLLGLLPASAVICAVGLADDSHGLRGRHKLLGQLLAIGLVMSSGLLVRNVRCFGWDLELGLMAVPFTAFWLLGAINSLNLLDGVDGLLSCLGVIITLAMAVMAILGGQWAAAYVALALAGALLGFLVFNFPPASIFLGDSGSMLIGLVVGVLAIHSSLKGPATIALAAPLALLTVPIFDTLAAIVRRKLTGRSLYTTDRGHLHHCLLRRGLSSRGVLLWISSFCLLTVVGALSSLAFNNELFAILSALAVVGILVVTRLFGYAEYLLAKETLLGTAASFFHARPAGKARQSEVRLQGSANWAELWSGLTTCAVQLNLKAVRLDVNAPAIHEGYHASWQCPHDEGEDSSLWRAEIPLMVQGQAVGRIALVGQRDGEPVWPTIATLAKLTDGLETTVSTLTCEASQPSPATRNPKVYVVNLEKVQT